jgi:hypothetical protein
MEEKDEVLNFYYVWKGLIRTFHLDCVDWSDANNDHDLSWNEKFALAPKALGFVTLSPVIGLTLAGQELIQSKRKEEIFLRQLLKFQQPSPYHKPTDKAQHFG